MRLPLVIKEIQSLTDLQRDYFNQNMAIGNRSGKIKSFRTIGKAISNGQMGDIFQTPKSERFYVVTRSKWGKESTKYGRVPVYKGFHPDTPFKKILQFAQRTKIRHAKRYEEPVAQERRQKFKELLNKK